VHRYVVSAAKPPFLFPHRSTNFGRSSAVRSLQWTATCFEAIQASICLLLAARRDSLSRRGTSSNLASEAIETAGGDSALQLLNSANRVMPSLIRRVFGESGPVITAILVAGLYALFTHGDALYLRLLHSTFIRGDEKLLNFCLMGLWPPVVFYSYGALLTLVDFHPWFATFRATHKLQPRFQPKWSDYLEALKVSAFNFFVVGISWALFLAYVVIPWWGGDDKSWQRMPDLKTFAVQIGVTLFFQELLFYSSHRGFHHPSIYKYIHKQHHTFTAPFAIAAVYAHWAEHLIANMLPLSTGPLLMKMNPLLTALWTSIALLNTQSVHSGYQLPGMPSPESHDLHHRNYNCVYGTLGIMDFLFQTNGPLFEMVALKEEKGSVAWIPLPKESQTQAPKDGLDKPKAA
jgi:fatty acid hydroxylase domain-containing protein 2